MAASSSFDAGAGLSSISTCRTILPSPATIFRGRVTGTSGTDTLVYVWMLRIAGTTVWLCFSATATSS